MAADRKSETVLKGLRKQQKEIPFSLLYDMKGSQIYEEITHLEEYYLFNAEFELFKENALHIADSIIPASSFDKLPTLLPSHVMQSVSRGWQHFPVADL